MKYSLFSIKTLFNTHVGSGQNSYGIVDNVVQKEYLSERPSIYSSSLKGALREWFEKRLKKPDNIVKAIFGDANDSENGKEMQNKVNKPGTHHFFQAIMLSYPMRSDQVQFFNVTCNEILKDFKTYLNNFSISELDKDLDELLEIKLEKKQPVSITGVKDALVEFHDFKSKAHQIQVSDKIKLLFGDNLLLMHDDDFKKIINKLPIITRNKLENGQSSNLFYEEVVPRETFFAFGVGYENEEEHKFTDHYNKNDKNESINELIQIGANATVGYGFCKILKIM